MVRVALLLVVMASSVRAQEHKSPKPRRPADAPADAWIAHEMQPEASADSWCARNLEHAKKTDANTKNVCGPLATKAKLKLATPWTEARLLQLDEHSTGYVPLSQYIELAVQYDGKWFMQRIGHISHTEAGDHKQTVELRSVTVKDVVPGGTPELLIEYASTDNRSVGSSVESMTKHENMLVCGVGKSGTPSCVDVTLYEDEKNSVYKHRYRLAWSFDKTGRIVLKAKGAWPRNLERKEYEAKRPLYFP